MIVPRFQTTIEIVQGKRQVADIAEFRHVAEMGHIPDKCIIDDIINIIVVEFSTQQDIGVDGTTDNKAGKDDDQEMSDRRGQELTDHMY